MLAKPWSRIKEVAEATGLSENVLRIWEVRYDWPKPVRNPTNGYREYPQAMVDDLKRMAGLVHAGALPSHIIVDGSPRWAPLRPHAVPQWMRLDALPLPSEAAAIRSRERLVRLIKDRRAADIAQVMHCHVYLRAADRINACWLPVWYGHQLWLSAGRALDIRTFEPFFRRLAGSETLTVVHECWLAGSD